jgi:hypothetical protein
MARIHVCPVSVQPMPNLIPLRLGELRPERVVLLVSPDMKHHADRLEPLIRSWGIGVERVPVEPYRLDAAKETCLGVLTDLDGHDVVLNVTAGTKIVALAAFEVFRELEKEIIYVDTPDRVIQILSPEHRDLEFKGVIKVFTYLEAYGQTMVSDGTDATLVAKNRPIFTSLVHNLDRFERAVGELNRLISPLRHARVFPLEIELSIADRETPELEELLALFSEGEFMSVAGERVVIPDRYSAEFISGDWLDEYVFDVAASLHPTDVRMRVEIRWDQKAAKPTRNEYDVVFTAHNQLYLIECKTKRFSGTDREEASEETIYKLESLREAAGGLYGKGMLVSYRDLTEQQRRRLKGNGLEYCAGPELRNLKAQMRQWMA